MRNEGKDVEDIENKPVYKDLNWDLMDELIEENIEALEELAK